MSRLICAICHIASVVLMRPGISIEMSAALSGLQQTTLMMVLQVEMLLHPALLCQQLLQQLWQAPWPRL